MQTSIFLGNFNILEIVPVFWKFMEVIQEWWMYSIPSEFKISLIQSSEMSKNDSRTSGIPVGLVRRTTAYFWFSHKLHWLYIFQTSEWYIRTSDFYNPLARQTSAFNLKFRSLTLYNMHGMLKISIIFHAWHLWKLTVLQTVAFSLSTRPVKLSGYSLTQWISKLPQSLKIHWVRQ